MSLPPPRTFACDFDKTWTADPEAFLVITQILRARGHQFIIATNREHYSDDMRRYLPLILAVPIIYCGRELKEHACLKAGYTVDIWIDDTPGTIQHCAILGDQPL